MNANYGFYLSSNKNNIMETLYHKIGDPYIIHLFLGLEVSRIHVDSHPNDHCTIKDLNSSPTPFLSLFQISQPPGNRTHFEKWADLRTDISGGLPSWPDPPSGRI